MVITNSALGMGKELAQAIKDEAQRLGFSACGFANAEPVDDEVAQVVDHWTEMGFLHPHQLRIVLRCVPNSEWRCPAFLTFPASWL